MKAMKSSSVFAKTAKPSLRSFIKCLSVLTVRRSEATPTGELGGQEKPDWLGGQQPDERGIDEEV
ncbi:hypothetical protein T08_15564 [Trichinella sp. T8]|uniref:Uncharacterized protein n=1 Tax=Trichinella murrelli TaxID=144512 RepID=A0A0V0TAF3_9BILA|nr:hypothetical protein T05_3009 [Trichinella murrelli]KRZ86835.1 hypothetical protein T08_15564 [Trichinella sp. T8]